MKAKEVIIICPYSRPDFQQNVIDNYNRQTFKNKKLVIVENGDAVGTWKGPSIEILKSEHHQATAKNTGLDYVRDKHKGCFWTTFDDDDYYSSNYLEELVDNSDKAEVIGKLNVFMKARNGKMRFVSYGGENEFVDTIWGCTISSWIQDINFVDTGMWGEDEAWLELSKQKGAKIYSTSRYNLYINRHDNNTWKMADQNIVNTSFETVEFDFDPQIICGKDVVGVPVDKTDVFDYSHIEDMINLKENSNE